MSSTKAKRIISCLLSSALLISSFPSVFAEESNSDEEMQAALAAEYDNYPDGAFAFYESTIDCNEGDSSVYIDVVRYGGTDNEASVGFKAVDVSAEYGVDYTMTVEKSSFVDEKPEIDSESVPLMEMFAQSQSESEVVIGEQEETTEAPDETMDVALDMTTGDVSVNDNTDVQNVSEEEAAQAESSMAASDETESSEPELSETDEPQTDTSETVVEEQPQTGIKAAREAQLGVKSDRKSWQEITGTDNNETSELSETMDESKEYIEEAAENLPGAKSVLEFKPGEYKKTIRIDLVDDDISETDEQILLMLYNAENAEMAKPSTAYVNIKDNDEGDPVVFAMRDDEVIVTPDDEYASVTVYRTSGIDKFASVKVGTGDISAVPDQDYTAGTVEVYFPQGVTERTVKVPVLKSGKSEPVQLVAAIDTTSANAEEGKEATAITILPDSNPQTLELYEEQKEAAAKEQESVELMSNDTYTKTFNCNAAAVSSSNTNWSGKSTPVTGLDLRNAKSVKVTYEINGAYSYQESYKDGCSTKQRTVTLGNKTAEISVGTQTAYVTKYGTYNESGTLTFTNFSKTNSNSIAIRVKRDSPAGNGTVSARITKVEVEYERIRLYINNDDVVGNNSYVEKIYNANGKNLDSDTNMRYDNGETLSLGTVLADGYSSQPASGYYSYDNYNSVLKFKSVEEQTKKYETSEGVRVAVGKNVTLVGYQYVKNNTWSTDIIPAKDISFSTLINKIGLNTEYIIRPVYSVNKSNVKFNNSYSKLSYTNGIVQNSKTYQFNMLDTLVISGVGTGGSSVGGFGYTAGTKVSQNAAEPNVITVSPTISNIELSMVESEPNMTVEYNPQASTSKYNDVGSVYYFDADNPENSTYGDSENPMVISPIILNDQYTIRATFNDLTDDKLASDYTVRWQDFTGDDGDGYLTEDEMNDVKAYNFDRTPVTGDFFTYNPKAVNSRIYYQFVKREVNDNNRLGRIEGRVYLEERPVFGASGSEECKPINGATVTVDGETVSTATDENGKDGYFKFENNKLISMETKNVNIVYGQLSLNAAQPVNVATDYYMSADDVIGIDYSGARISKHDDSTDTDVEITENDLINDDAQYNLYIPTVTTISGITAKYAALTFYRSDGSYITEKEYSSDNGIFNCTFNPAQMSLPPGTTMKIQFFSQGYDENSKGVGYFNHDVGLTINQSLGAITLMASFAGKAKPALAVIGTISSKFNFGWDGNLDDTEVEKEVLDGDGKVTASIKNTDTQKVLSFGFSYNKKDDGGDDDKNDKKEELKDVAKNPEASTQEKQDAAKSAVDEDNTTKGELAVGYNVEFNFAISLTLGLETEGANKGTYYFDEFMLVVSAGAEVNAERTYVTPIGIPIIIGCQVGVSGQAIFVVEDKLDNKKYYLADLTSDTDGTIDIINAGKAQMSDYVYMYGDFTIQPKIGLTAGIGIDSFNIKLNGTAEFTFNFTTQDKDDTGNVEFTCSLSIKIIVFEKSWTLANTTVSLFSDSDQLYEDLDTFEIDNRERLENRSGWNDEVSLASVDDTSGLKETILRNGVNPNGEIKMMPIGDDRYIAVFIDDVPERSDANSTAAYYSIYSNGNWSEPEIIEDDGTLDSAPEIFDLGDGRLFIAWSTADREFGEDAQMLDMLNSMNIHGVFFNTDDMSMGDIIEVTKSTDEDTCEDTDPRIAYDPATGKMIIYYTKSLYEATDGEEGVFGDAVYPYTMMTYRKLDVNTMTFDPYSPEEEAQIKEDLASMGETDIDAAYDQYIEDYYYQRFLSLAPAVTVSENINEQGFAESEPVITEYTSTDPVVVESDAISYNGLGLFAYVLDYDGSKETTNDRDIFLQIYNFSEDSVSHTMMITSDDVEDSNLRFERIGGEDGITYLAYLSGGNIRMFNISDNLSNDNVTIEGVTSSGQPYYYLNRTADSGYIPPLDVVTKDGSGDYSGERTITGFDIKSNDKYFYTMFTERSIETKDGVEEGTSDAVLAENNPVETQIMMTRYDIENDVLTAPLSVTDEEGANYANVAFALDNDNGFMAMAEKSMSIVETVDGVDISADDENNASLCSLSFKPESVITLKDAQIGDIIAGTGAAATFRIYNEGFDTVDGLTVEVHDLDGNTITPQNSDENGLITSYSLTGGESAYVNVNLPVAEDGNKCGFTAVVKDAEGNKLAEISDSKEAQRIADVTRFDAQITERGKVSFTADIANAQSVATGTKPFNITCGDKVLYTQDIDSIMPGETVTISGEFDIDYDELFTSVTNEDGSIEANADLKAKAGVDGTEQTDTIGLYASADQMAAMNAVSDVDIVKSVEIEQGEFKNIAAELTFDDGFDAENAVQITYVSEDPSVAQMYNGGYIDGVSEGNTKVKAIITPRYNQNYDGELISSYPILPEEAFKVYEIDVTVGKASETPEPTDKPSSGGSSGGNSSGSSGGSGSGAIARPNTSTGSESSVSAQQYTDVSADAWYNEAVKYVTDNGIMNGVSDTEFAPQSNITRAMFVTMLYRMSGESAPQNGTLFGDTPDGTWYSDAVKWASVNGIVLGITDTEFGPDLLITREQLCAMLTRYMDHKSIALEENTEAVTFADESEISSYALDSVYTLQRCGIVNGRDEGMFVPQGNATRAESAAIIARFMQAL